MPGPPKITLGQALKQRDFIVSFHCWNPNHCHQRGEMRLDAAIKRWGEALRLDQIPARCTKCGERKFVDVRSRPPLTKGGQPLGEVVET